jgi:hypothetical protein
MQDFKNKEDFIESHGYVIDDVWYPRVTKIVEIKAKPALYRFYARMENFEAGERMKKLSAEEGTMVHEAVEDFLVGKTPVVDPRISPSVDAFLRFQEENNIEVRPEFVELRLLNRDERYAGTLDAIATIGGKTGILDIKTSQEIYRDYNLQTSAYVAAMKDIVPDLETRWILRIDQAKKCIRCGALLRTKGGRPQVKTQFGNKEMWRCRHEWGPTEGIVELKEFPEWKPDYHAFLGAKKLWEWDNEDILKEVGYL